MNDDLPPLPEPVEVLDLWGNDCPVYNREQMRAYAIAYARAAVLAERERCAKVCEADPDAVFAAIWKSLVIPGEFDAMDETDKNRWRGVIMQAIGLTSERMADVIRKGTP